MIKLAKAAALSAAQNYGIDFKGDYHAVVSSDHAQFLADLARGCGYRKPKNANGSTARYFFNHLKKMRTYPF